jgi:hypothetical protein
MKLPAYNLWFRRIPNTDTDNTDELMEIGISYRDANDKRRRLKFAQQHIASSR